MINKIAIVIGIGVVVSMIYTGCTISFQNIDTHGTATDLIDENQTASPDVSPEVSLPEGAI